MEVVVVADHALDLPHPERAYRIVAVTARHDLVGFDVAPVLDPLGWANRDWRLKADLFDAGGEGVDPLRIRRPTSVTRVDQGHTDQEW
jgi:hypothetical protein